MRTPHLTAWSSPSLSTMFRLRIAAGPRRLAVHRGVSSAAKESVTLEKQGQIGIVRLNDPNRLNALTADMGDRVEELVQEIKDRADEFRAIVLTGEGRAFSAGGDLDFLQKRASDTTSRNTVTMRKFYGRFLSLRSLPVPLIAALNGPAIGAGMCISLFADARVVAKDAKLGFTFVHLGLHPVRDPRRLYLPCDGSTRVWRARIISRSSLEPRGPTTYSLAARYSLIVLVLVRASSTSKVISGQEAFELGLATKVVSKVVRPSMPVECSTPSWVLLGGRGG
ncbi:hypothetical protein, variant 1 [Aphanomyces invadans]|uniref:Uncharacterized protein n=1 Tax=Aphanomyces invadans TaxID=157072 RepID=A0A024UT30_9STRA|nr:hypothetical protein, variant 1 [Aphanomyces invadans]ETW08813.1 hypothetical protein, variant 1 [Aphanomyces invadans]|eukprot:XP_008862618.1 hypothetical protein, variant 1 [Aphanomyces invadans]